MLEPEDIPFNDQATWFEEASDRLAEVLRGRSGLTPADALQAAQGSLSDYHLRLGLSYGKSTGKIRLDLDSWTLSVTEEARGTPDSRL